MANEFKHKDYGVGLSRAEWEKILAHVFDSQATGDIMYASSATQLSRLAKGAARRVLGINQAGTLPEWQIPVFHGIVDAAGGGHWTTLQAGDDVLGSADYTMQVKSGNYGAGLIVATNDAYIYVEPGTEITGAIELSGSNITLKLGSGCDIIGLITISGHNNRLLCENGCDLDGISITGDWNLVDGGGWDTIVDGGVTRSAISISANANGNIVKDIAAQTTAGQGNAHDGVDVGGFYFQLIRIRVVNSDEDAIHIATGGHGLVEACLVHACDRFAIFWDAAECRFVQNHVLSAAQGGIYSSSVGDNSVITGNIIDNPTGAPINIPAAVEDCVVVGNRTDGAIVDNSGTSTVASNDETAF